MDILAVLIWLGGALKIADDIGFWRALVWPYYLGRYLASKCVEVKS